MKNLQALLQILLAEEQLHKDDIYNYAIPEAWNIYGYKAIRRLRDHQLLINPYTFYAYTLQHLLKEEKAEKIELAKNRDWLKKSVIYAFMVRSATAWDHDRDTIVHHDNLYHLSDSGTFLKSIALLPLLKRMGVNTILLYQPFALGKTKKAHDYAPREAVIDFTKLDETLSDPILKGMNVQQQGAAFIEACHYLGFRVLLEYCPAVMARDNKYIKKHPEWFYWITKKQEATYHAPLVHTLPQNTIPYPYTQKDLYRSEDVLEHISSFVDAPSNVEEKNLTSIEKENAITIAPSIVDQINANIDADRDTTILRFYKDLPVNAPKKASAYMLQDSIRCDIYPGKQAMNECWKQLNTNIPWFQKNLDIDGIYLAKPYLLPQKLQKDFVKTARKNNPSFAMIVEDSVVENSKEWMQKGYDMISGNSGYEETSIWDYKFHSFAYRLKSNECLMFTASEFCDSSRVGSLEHGKSLAIMLSVMNYFLPNGVPMLLNGIESFDPQPSQLSVYGDSNSLTTLPKEDVRYARQSFLDQYCFNYIANDLATLINLLETCAKIRKEYITAITDAEHSIPVWFDTPKDPGIGFSFVMEKKALMVVSNVDVTKSCNLHIHTDNLFPNLPFKPKKIQQMFSTSDPYLQDIEVDALGNLSLYFAAGEVKFITFK